MMQPLHPPQFQNDATSLLPSHCPKINFEDVKLLSLLKGEEKHPGSPNNVSFLCMFGKLKCVFKCYRLPTGPQQPVISFPSKEMSEFEHPNILRVIGVVLKRPRLGVVYEHLDQGNIRQFFEKNPGLLTTSQKLLVLHDLADVLVKLEESTPNESLNFPSLNEKKLYISKVSRREKEENESKPKFEQRDYMIKYRHFSVDVPTKKRIARYTHLKPPELENERKWLDKSIVYVYGVICNEILTENFLQIDSKVELSNFECEAHWVTELVKKCCSKEVEERPSFREILLEFHKNGVGAAGDRDERDRVSYLLSSQEEEEENSVKIRFSDNNEVKCIMKNIL